MSNAIDLATPLTPTTAGNFFKNGITHVGRYLSHSSWKGLTPNEVSAIKGAGLQIFSLFEKASTDVGYFTAAQGVSDAYEAYTLAKQVAQPEGTVIYFTVDFDAQAKDYPAILNYFQTVKANLKGYVMGLYGSYNTLTFLQPKGLTNYYFQTVAWSRGQRCSFANLYQYQCDKPYLGLNVDFVNVLKTDVGAWGQVVATAQSVAPVASVWKKENGVWYYYQNGVKKVNSWIRYKNLWYYVKADGAMAQGWIQYNQKWYYLNPAPDKGEMLTGWITVQGKKYYCDLQNGDAYVGKHVIDGKTYQFAIDCSLIG